MTQKMLINRKLCKPQKKSPWIWICTYFTCTTINRGSRICAVYTFFKYHCPLTASVISCVHPEKIRIFSGFLPCFLFCVVKLEKIFKKIKKPISLGGIFLDGHCYNLFHFVVSLWFFAAFLWLKVRSFKISGLLMVLVQYFILAKINDWWRYCRAK